MDYHKFISLLPQAKDMVRSGYSASSLTELGLSHEDANLLYSIALANIRYSDKFSKDLLVDVDSARLATHEIVADYHARRLKTHVVADIGCGVGIQLAHFAMHSDRAIGVELDKTRAEFARINAELLGVDVDVIVGDAYDPNIINSLGDVDIVFSDPARPLNEPVRKLSSCQPNPSTIVEKYSRYTDLFAFDLPPQIRRERVKLGEIQEFEYISLDGRLNRLTVYLNDLARFGRSAVVLPGEHRLVYNPELSRHISISPPKSFLFDVDGAVFYADLIPELVLLTDTSVAMKDKRRALMTSDDCVESPFFRGIYSVVSMVSRDELKPLLAREGFGNVIIRYSIPADQYYPEKANLESGLTGDKTAYIFRYEGKYLVSEKASCSDHY